MTAADTSPTGSPATARLVAALWFVTAALGALPGMFLADFAEDASARAAAFFLLACSAVALAAGLWVAARGASGLTVSLGASALVAVGAAVALAVLSTHGIVSARGGLLLFGVPVTGSVLTAVAAAVRRRTAKAR